MRWMNRWVVVLLIGGCAGSPPTGVAPTEVGQGPMVVYEPQTQPEPEVPLPTNAATRIDPTSPTGRRLNLATDSPIEPEAKLRRQLNRLDGFSVVGPVTVSFDAPLDLETVTDETVMIVDADPASPDFGEAMPLDLGRGAYPAQFKKRHVFPYDPLADLPDLIFAEDNDVDGVRVEHYEVATNTLILRALFPLRPKTTYAVVLTQGIKGLKGHPVQSPFPSINLAAQTDALRPVLATLEDNAHPVAFAWTFTTQSITDGIVALREGMDGEGPFAWLREAYPGRLLSVADLGIDTDGDGTFADKGLPDVERDHRYMLKPNFMRMLLKEVGGALGYGLDQLDFPNTDYLVWGTLESPDFRSPIDNAIWVEPALGTVDHKAGEVTFMISVPKATPEHQPPFPVVIYSHGARTSRLELMLITDSFAKRGYAMMGIDAVGHGPFGGDLMALIEREGGGDFPPELIALALGYAAAPLLGDDYSAGGKSLDEVLDDLAGNGLWSAMFEDGRAEDLDGDGVLISGDGYFVPNPFELSSNARQTILDTLMVYRLLNRLTQDAIPGPGLDDPRNADAAELMPYLLAGDFNADGVLDLGGAGNRYAAAGTSLGGIHTSMILAVEPGLVTGVPIVSGGGMVDILIRTTLTDAVDAIFAELSGPAVVACPRLPEEGSTAEEVSLTWNNWSLKCRDEVSIQTAEIVRVPAVPGGTAVLYNARIHDEGGPIYLEDALHQNPIADDGGFHVTVAASEGDVLQLTLRDPEGVDVFEKDLLAPRGGLGRQRNTPRMRRTLQIAQWGMDRGDPLAYARHLLIDPLPGSAPCNVLHLADVGDRTVPFSTMVAWDRAVGLHGLDRQDAMGVTNEMVSHGSLLVKKPYWDIDDLLEEGDGIGPLPLIETSSGVSAVRYPYTDDHEYIAVVDPDAPIDWATYSRNQLLHFIDTDGKEIRDDLCMEDGSCPWLLSNIEGSESSE